MEEFEIAKSELKSLDAETISLLVLLFQTGYLTIKDFSAGNYKLGFPNLEVQSSLQKHMVSILIENTSFDTATFANTLYSALCHEDIEKISDLLTKLFSHIPSKLHIPEEKFYHALLITTFQACEIQLLAEHSTADGCIDLVLEPPKLLYIVEIKFNQSALNALHQIEKKKYYLPFLDRKKKILLLGLDLTHKTHREAGETALFTIIAKSKLLALT